MKRLTERRIRKGKKRKEIRSYPLLKALEWKLHAPKKCQPKYYEDSRGFSYIQV